MPWLTLAHLLVAVIWDPVPVDGVSERYLQVAIACDFPDFLQTKAGLCVDGTLFTEAFWGQWRLSECQRQGD